MSNKYTSISVPKKFAERINKFLEENPELGYSSIADFIKEAVRNHLTNVLRNQTHTNHNKKCLKKKGSGTLQSNNQEAVSTH